MEKDWVLIGLVVAAISLIVALIGLGAMGFFHLDSRIDAQGAELSTAIGAQGAELRAAIDAQGAELREGFKHVDQRIDGLYDLIAQDRR